ncbi:MAG: RNB domain-containing ribonuclease, partial [Pseudohongiellaceae bacterium]
RLHEARIRGGALDFNTTETRIVFGENRKIKEIVPVLRNSAHRLIEECMLCANVATALLLEASGLPVLYRVHAGPNEEKLQNLREYLLDMGLMLGGGEKPRPKDYQALLARVAERPDAHLLQTVIIRSLMQAVYQPENVGHFGLGYDAYTHFTSPIRRYPDLLVHRAIRHLIRSGKRNGNLQTVKGAEPIKKQTIYPYDGGEIAGLGDHCSVTERRADAASYDVINWLKCEYIQGRLGEEFSGTVASVTSFGLFVELDDIYIEGLVHITALDNDYYHFDLARHQLVGERSGKKYSMGDTLRVVVAAVSLDERKIDLTLAGGSARTVRKPGDKQGRQQKPGSSQKQKAGNVGKKKNRKGKRR